MGENKLLRQARLATPSPSGSGRPMSQRELAEEINRRRGSCELTDRSIRRYESGQVRCPGPEIRDALRGILRVDNDADLGFQRDVGTITPDPPQSPTLGRLRRDLDTALGSCGMTAWQLQALEESTSDHIDSYPVTAPAVMLGWLEADCVEVVNWSQRRQPAAIQARLSRVAALQATMCADALMRLGQRADAHGWYRSALHAATDSGDIATQVLVHAQAAMLPYYFGSPRVAVDLADAALALSGQPSGPVALAAAGKARALAKLGAHDAARTAIAEAHRIFDAVSEGTDEDGDRAFVFGARRFLFYLSGTYTYLGDWAHAARVQDEALRLYGSRPTVQIDPALIELDRALCLAATRSPAEAASLALATVCHLPESIRTEIVLSKAQQVVTATPPNQITIEVQTLRDFLHSCHDQSVS